MLTRLRNALAARRLVRKSRRPYTVELDSGPLVVLPGVLDPVATRVGLWLAGVMTAQVRPGERWVDMGCGTGVVGLAMAAAGADVIAADIDPACAANARANAALRRARLRAVTSDLFAALQGVPIDGVVYNVPFWPGEPAGRPFGRAMYAGPAFEAIRRYRSEAAAIPRVLLALSESGPRHAEARAAFGEHRVIAREQVGREWLVLLEA